MSGVVLHEAARAAKQQNDRLSIADARVSRTIVAHPDGEISLVLGCIRLSRTLHQNNTQEEHARFPCKGFSDVAKSSLSSSLRIRGSKTTVWRDSHIPFGSSWISFLDMIVAPLNTLFQERMSSSTSEFPLRGSSSGRCVHKARVGIVGPLARSRISVRNRALPIFHRVYLQPCSSLVIVVAESRKR